ncbi:PKD domain-containing protein [Maribellus sp. YY47]|uniref:PKD domain-containing protein n=1 Tax=Maribellus sp. YY47 TaxID=2929486 RepID=UPI00200168E9|nr:PKD domain-containing protein [Maribellus sp. YY47]MCK3686199.1 PKD domain-containing protein [Maribellus sp. YY47]
MKNKIYFNLMWLFALMVMFGCEPYMEDGPESSINLPPDPSTMDFSITPGDDAYHFKVNLVSPQLSGISTVSFNLGNGATVKSSSATAYYPLPGDYTITMTILTNGGSSSVTKTHTTTETDYSIFTDEKYVFLSGGASAAQGKTWVVDSLTWGHFGIGPAGGTWPEWWGATPLQKTNSGAYDDEFVFKIEGFVFDFNNNGDSYVKDFRKNLPYYSNPEPLYGEADCKVNYNPAPATWTITNKADGDYLILSSETPAFFGFDYGAVDNEFRIDELSENKLSLSCIGGDGNRWYYILIPKGYEPPKIEYTVGVQAGSGINAYEVHFTVNNIPAGQSIDNISVDFGNGTVQESTDVNEVFTNTYMRKGTYMITVTTTTSLGVLTKTQTLEITENHPDYVEFLLDEMVMYNDFSEVIMIAAQGQDCSVSTVDNPNRQYPNKSTKVGFYSKTANPYANAFMQLPSGYRFDLRQLSTFKMQVYGKAGDVVLLKLENTDWGGEAWMSGVELTYTIQQDNTWEVVEYNFKGIANNGAAGSFFTNDVTDPNAAVSHDFYNVVRIMLNPGVDKGTHEFYFDELAGPHVEGIKSASR